MGKSFKKVATVVGIVAIGIATWGVGSLIAGGAAVGSALGGGIAFGSLGSLAVSFSTLASIGILGLSIGFTPNLPGLDRTGANARGVAFANPDALGAFVFGTTTVPSALQFEEIHGTDDALVSNILAHAWHRIESYQTLHVDNEVVSFSGDNATGDYAGILTWKRKLGAPAQTAIALSGTVWPATTPAFAGVAHSAMTWNFKNQDKLKGGVPTQIDVIVEGAWLYDPRLDTSAGGSGSQVLTDPTTWSFNDGNAALVLLRVLIGEYTPGGDLIWGRGAGYADIDLDTFIAMADVADETLDTKPRFRLGGMWLLDGDFEGFVRRWEAETGGKLSKSGGVYRCWLPHDDLTSLTTITEADFLADVPLQQSLAGDIGALFNCARGRYIEPGEGYRGFPYPSLEESTAITADGVKRPLYLDFSWVQDASIAERTARLQVRRSRFPRVWTVALGWKGQGPNYRPFTVHTLVCPETGGDAQLVRVVERVSGFGGPTILVLQQEDASIYDDTLPLGDPHASNTIPNRLDRLGTVTPRYIDGTSIDDAPAVNAALSAANGIQWRQSPNDGAWSPTATTLDVVVTFYFAGVVIATHTIRGTRSGSNVSAATLSETGEATVETINNNGTPAVTVIVTHTASGTGLAFSFFTVESGDDGVDGDDGAPGDDGADGPPGLPGLPGINTLNADPYFRQPDQHWFSNSTWTLTAEDEASYAFPTITDGQVGRQVLRYAGSDSDQVFSEEIPIDPTQTYRVSVWARETAANPNNYLAVAFIDGSGANIVGSSSSATGWTFKGTYHYWDVSNAEFSAAWTRYEFVFGQDAGADGTIPSGAVACRIGALINNSSEASCGVELAEFKLETTLGTVMIRDGAIVADKLSVAQLSAIAADLGAVTAGTITLATTGFIRSPAIGYDGNGVFIGRAGGEAALSIRQSPYFMRFKPSTGLEVISRESQGLRVKTADEVVNNSNTLQDDNHMTGLELVANQLYSLEMFFKFLPPSGAAGANSFIKWFLNFSQTPAINGHGISMETNPGLSSQIRLKDFSSTTNVFAGEIDTESGAFISGTFRANASVGGTLKVQWSQQVAAAVNLTLRQSSYIRLIPLAG